MALNSNQFKIQPVQGEMDMQVPGTVITCQVDAAQATALVAGQAVKLATTAGGVPKVLSLATDYEGVFGFVSRNPKDADYSASKAVEIATNDSWMYMTASGAITRGSRVVAVTASNKVAAYANDSATIIGMAMDTAAADGDLIRVAISTPSAVSNALRTINFTATLAEINAGKVVIPGVAGKQLRIDDFIERVTGAFATGTSVNLQSDATGVIVEASAEAGLTNGAVLIPGTANVTLGAGFGALLPAGEGLKVVNVGSAQTGGTSINWTVSYAFV